MSTLFANEDVRRLYDESLHEAGEALASRAVAEGRAPRLGALSGWVFEQVVRYCLARELGAAGLGEVEIGEQPAIAGRARADLLVGRAAIEVKVAGSFGASDRKYGEYRREVERAFFLDSVGDWGRFVGEVIACCQGQGTH